MTIRIKGKWITDAGLIGDIIHETPTTITVKIVDTFFPVHDTRWGKSQVEPDRRAFLHDHIVGQTRKFWTSGSRKGLEIGGNHQIIEGRT